MQDAGTSPVPEAGGAEAYSDPDKIRSMEQHSEIAENPSERLSRVQTLKAQATNDLNTISSAGTQDLGNIQNTIAQIAEALNIPAEELQDLLTRAEEDWQSAYDIIAAKLEEVSQMENELIKEVEEQGADNQTASEVPSTQ